MGPRFILNPIRVFRGSFGGQTLWENEAFVSPGAARHAGKKRKGEGYAARKGAQRERRRRKEDAASAVPEDPLADVFR